MSKTIKHCPVCGGVGPVTNVKNPNNHIVPCHNGPYVGDMYFEYFKRERAKRNQKKVDDFRAHLKSMGVID